MVTAAALKSLVEAFLERTRMSPSRFGKEALTDPNFVFDLREGREPRSEVVRRVVDFMEARSAEVPETERAVA